jgi:hypothetical protein
MKILCWLGIHRLTFLRSYFNYMSPMRWNTADVYNCERCGGEVTRYRNDRSPRR